MNKEQVLVMVAAARADTLAALDKLVSDVSSLEDSPAPEGDVAVLQAEIEDLKKKMSEVLVEKESISVELEAVKASKAEEDVLLAADEKKIGDVKAILDA